MTQYQWVFYNLIIEKKQVKYLIRSLIPFIMSRPIIQEFHNIMVSVELQLLTILNMKYFNSMTMSDNDRESSSIGKYISIAIYIICMIVFCQQWTRKTIISAEAYFEIVFWNCRWVFLLETFFFFSR